MKSLVFALFLFSLSLSALPAPTATKTQVFICGMAIGYPPYQYLNNKKEPSGIDYEVAKLVFKTAGLEVQFIPGEWQELLNDLIHNDRKIECLCGTEISPERSKYLDFTVPYNNRKIVLFFLKEKKFKTISDLFSKLITGDRHSSFEKYLGDKRDKIRIMETFSKEESFKKLKDGQVEGVIAPLEVGLFLSKKFKLNVSYIEDNDKGTPVSIAVSKGNTGLLNALNGTILKLLKTGEIHAIIKKKNWPQ